MKLEVQIMGQSYLLACPEGGEKKLRAAVQRVDVAMCKIRDAGKVRERGRIAVLAALNLAFDLNDTPAETPADTPAETLAVASTVSPAVFAQPQATASSPASASTPTAPDPGRDSAAINTLLNRLDQALKDDGQLLKQKQGTPAQPSGLPDHRPPLQ